MSGGWTESDEQRLLALLRYEANVPPLSEFIVKVSPHLPPPRHLGPLIDAWERTRRGAVYAVVELPPRHAKTTTCCHGFAWRLSVDPALQHAFCTYADALSLDKSRVVRRMAKAAGVALASGQTHLHHWKTDQEGGFIATGVGGPLTGKGITGVAVVDDPIKNRQEAESRRIRDRVWDWFRDVLWTRLEDEASVFVVQTRWHKDDLVGRLLARGDELGVEFERIRLPAIADEEGDLLGRELGTALWPERFPVTKLNEIRSMLGEYGWWSLYQQEPRIKGDQVFRGEPGRFALDEWQLDGHRVLIVCDPAATEKTYADYTAILVLAAKGFGDQMRVWVLDHFRAQVKVTKVAQVLAGFQKRYWGVAIGVESVGAFRAIPDMLQEADPSLRVLRITPLGDKYTRAQPVASAYNEGRVLIPIDRPWAKTLLAELDDFTGVNDVHDDQVDALAHGFNTLFSTRAPHRRGTRRSRFLPFG